MGRLEAQVARLQEENRQMRRETAQAARQGNWAAPLQRRIQELQASLATQVCPGQLQGSHRGPC